MKHASFNPAAFLRDENLRTLHGRKKVQYIWDYYKLPLAVLCIVLYAAGYMLYGRITHKDTVLYAALVNVAAGEDLTQELTGDFLDYLNLNPSKNELELYTGLYLTDDETNQYHEYTYASRMKIQAAIDGELMDVVLMNREAFDAFSQSGYLYDLKELLCREDPDRMTLCHLNWKRILLSWKIMPWICCLTILSPTVRKPKKLFTGSIFPARN